MIDIKAYNIRWFNPNSTKPFEKYWHVKHPDTVEAYPRMPDYVMSLPEEEKKKHIEEAIMEYHSTTQPPYSFDYEIIQYNENPPTVVVNPERWKQSLQRKKKSIKLPEWPPKKPKWFRSRHELEAEKQKRREEE